MKLLKDKRVVMTLLAIILVLVVMSSTTYALFFKVHTMENVESYTTGVLEITVEEGTALSLSNSLPMEDSEGSSLTPYTFKVTNTGNLAYTFDLKLLSTTTSNQINSKYIKVKLDNNEPVLLSSLSNGLIASDLTLNPNESVTMSIRIWLSIDTPNTEIGKNFSAKIVTDGVGSEYVVPDTGAYYIESLLTSNPETMNNDDPDGNVRYMGADPNNYVSFNDELWRIIGVFDVASTNGGPTEKRLKIIRDESIGSYAWDNKPSGTGSSNSIYGGNDWTDSVLMEVLNNGAYWNRTSGTCPSGSNGATTSCNFSSTGLTEEAKNLIGDAVWNLGGTASYTSASTGLASHFYGYERGTTVYSGRPTYWIGKIGLMYPSDYGYATSGGTTTNRASCLAKEMYNWVSSSYSDCKNNDYLYNSSSTQWTMTPRSSNSSNVFGVLNNARLNYFNAYYGYAVLPTAYLKSTVKITGGDGTSGNPYTLEGPTGAEYIESLLTSNPETMNNDDPDGNVRYMGADPNNYVSFNNELWRIIGVFDVASTNGGATEKRLKIIRDESSGNMAWDDGRVNDWSQASLQEYLNGDYYSSLTSKSQSLVGDTCWNLGGTASYTSASNGLASHFYNYERGTTVYSGRPTYWIGKIGLMYSSDYGYATSGGTTTNRASCLAKEMFGWDNSSYSDCKNNDYLYDSSLIQWTITPNSDSSISVFRLHSSGSVGGYRAYDSVTYAFPALYLKSDVKIISGNGTQASPYQLG